MKKVCSILLCVSMVFCLCSCGDDETTNTTSEEVTENVDITTSEEVEITTEEEKETTILDTETELYNDNGFVISILSVVDNGFETTINLVFQNNLDEDYKVFSNGIAINNLCVSHDTYIAETFTHGVKTKIPITISNKWLSDNGITEISTLSFCFYGLDEDYNTEWVSNKVTVNTNLYDENAEYTPSCEQVYSDDNCTVWFDSLEDNIATFIVKNNTTRAITYQLEDCAINDWAYDVYEYMLDSDSDYYSTCISEMTGNSYAIVKLEITEDFMNECSIDIIEKISLAVRFYGYSDDYFDITSEQFTVTP